MGTRVSSSGGGESEQRRQHEGHDRAEGMWSARTDLLKTVRMVSGVMATLADLSSRPSTPSMARSSRTSRTSDEPGSRMLHFHASSSGPEVSR